MKRLLLGLVFCLTNISVIAQNEIVIVGAGTTACDLFIKKITNDRDKEVIKLLFESWAQGYISGRNKQLNTMSYTQLNLDKVGDMGNLLKLSCSDARKQGFGEAPVAIVLDKVFQQAFETMQKKNK